MSENSYSTIKCELDGPVARLSFNRPEIHNAFNSTLIEEMLHLLNSLNSKENLRVVVLTGKGKSFCAGADLNWMKSVVDQSFEQNLSESNRLAELFYAFYSFPKPIIGRINGAAIGGGCGFVAVCDVAVAAASAVFSFSEVKIGIVPACIAPYVIKKCGEGKTRELFITGERIKAEHAAEVGLINRVVEDTDLDSAIDDLCRAIVSSGPEAVKMAKELIASVPAMSPDQFKPYTAEMIARLRQSDEGQEGMHAFLAKRKPNWCSDDS